MSELSKVAAGRGRGSRLSAKFLGLVPMAALLAACGGGGSSGGEGDMVVVAVTPTNGQETLTDLSDPELGGQVTVKFSEVPDSNTMIDPTNAFNGLTPNVQVLNQGFVRVQGTPSVDKQSRAFTFAPAGGLLTPNQYTLTVSHNVGTKAGHMLNSGIEDFSASWTVGPDIYNPVIRNTSPAPNQSDTPIYTPIVVTFNESLDPASVVLGQTVFIQDGGTNPPTQLLGTLQLKRDGFDMVFTPDPCTGMPPSTTIVVRMLGAGNTSFLKDRVGNALVGDPNNANEVQFQFNTKGVKPLPNPLNLPGVWSPRINPFTGWDAVAYAVTNRATYAFDVSNVLRTFSSNLTTNPSLTVQVKQGNTGTVGEIWVVTITGVFVRRLPASSGFAAVHGPYGGDWEAKLGQPGEAVVDWRFDSVTGHSYIYQLDEADESVAIINSGTSKIEGHFRGVGTPKGISISGPGSTGLAPVIYVSNYGQGTVTGIPVGTIVPGLPICTAVKELQDDNKRRVYLTAGKNPSGVACEYFGLPIGAVTNQADNEVQFFDPATLAPLGNGLGTVSQRFTVGESPIDVAFSGYDNFNNWLFAFIVNQGGEENPEGSVSLWWNSNTVVGLFRSNSGSITGTLTDGVNVPGRPTSDPLGFYCWLGNTAGSDVIKAQIVANGSGLGTNINLKTSISREVGPNPTRMTWTGNPQGLTLAFASLAGAGQVAVWERSSIIGPPDLYPVPGVNSVFSAWDQ
jgi:hypothetical protein